MKGLKLNHTLDLKIDSQDKILEATYQGQPHVWLDFLMRFLIGKTVNEAHLLTPEILKKSLYREQKLLDLLSESSHDIFFAPLELLTFTLDKYLGKNYLYHEDSPLVCRCFNIKERDVVDYLNSEEHPTLAGLGVKTKAGLGCRTCKPQLERWMKVVAPEGKNPKRYFKNRPVADWLILAEEKLSLFPMQNEWKMEITSFKDATVTVEYEKSVSQREEEEVGRELQTFLGEAVDLDLSFILSRSRQRSKASR